MHGWSIIETIADQMRQVLSTTILRLVVAAILGGVIGLERELKHKPAGLRTNMFICFGSAMFTILSAQLAGSFGGDHTRIAAQIIPGIGFIGAGSILHSRGTTTGLTTAATVFVVASIGMAAGGGFYITAVFATGAILVALAVLGQLEAKFSLKSMLLTYEVVGKSTEAVINELHRIMNGSGLALEGVTAVPQDGNVRVTFQVKGVREELEQLTVSLHESPTFLQVKPLSSVEHE